VDLPGTYSLSPASPDEQVTRDVVLGKQRSEKRPDALVVVVDASNLDNHLRFALELIALGLPTVVALNMVDLATRDGLELDAEVLSRELGVPVIPTVAVRKRGLEPLRTALEGLIDDAAPKARPSPAGRDFDTLRSEARRIAQAAIVRETPSRRLTAAVDRVALHPVFGLLLLLGLLFVMFQAVYAWSEAPIAMIEGWAEAASNIVSDALPSGILDRKSVV